MPTRRENIQSTLKSNGRARTFLAIVGVVVIIMVVFGVMSAFRKEPPAIAENSTVPPPPNRIQDIPGGSTDPTYNQIQREDNALRSQSMQPGDTSLPTLTADPVPDATAPWNEDSTPPQPQPQPQPEPPAPVQPAPVVQAPPPVQPVYQPSLEPQVAAPSPQYDQGALEDRYKATAQQLNNYLAAWSVVPAGSQEFAFNGQRPPAPEVSAGTSMGGTSSAISGASPARSTTKQASLVRAGTVIPAVLMSTINSDNKGPVLAQITSGPLAGTRLLGTFDANEKALVLNFQTMTNPRLGTFSINALAVDEKYAIGMSTDVDNHYFRRYGLLMAGALLEGYGEAMGRANTVVVTGPLGTTTTQGELSSKEVNAVAMGRVGQAMSQELINRSRVAPTIHMDCKGGCPVGILFMSDL